MREIQNIKNSRTDFPIHTMITKCSQDGIDTFSPIIGAFAKEDILKADRILPKATAAIRQSKIKMTSSIKKKKTGVTTN